MNTTIFNYHTTNANFAHDVANAVRQLFVSLFAKKPAGVATDMVAERSAEETIWWLSSTASETPARA